MTFSNSKSMDVIQLLFQQKETKEHERPPPYSYSTRTGNAPFLTASTSGVIEDMPPLYS